MKTIIKFNDVCDVAKFMKSCVFEGSKDFTYSWFDNLEIDILFKQITCKCEITLQEVEQRLKKNKVKYQYIQQF